MPVAPANRDLPPLQLARYLPLFVAALLGAALVAPARAVEGAQRRYDIPAGDAAAELRQFAHLSGREILFVDEAVRGVRANAVQGEYTARAALDRMLAGTPLQAVEDGQTGAFAVIRAEKDASAEVHRGVNSQDSHAPPAANKMKTPRLLSTALALLGIGVAHAQPAATTTPDEKSSEEKTVVLPAFTISSNRVNSFTGSESLALTRTGVKLADIPQSVTVLNRAFIDTISPTAINWVVQYVGGGQVGNIPMYEATDRFALRGFTSQGDFIDGFLTIFGLPMTTNYIEQIEVIKGPAAIMSTNASGVVGGAVNKVSVSPTASQVNKVTLDYGRFDSASATIDVGGALTADKKLLWRVLGMYTDQDGYFDYQYLRRRDIMPMLSYRFNDTTEAWIKAEFAKDHLGSYNGLQIDGRTNKPEAVPVKTNFGEDDPLNWRTLDMWRVWGQFTTRPSDHLAIRFAAFAASVDAKRVETQLAPSGTTTPTLQPDGSFRFTPFVQYAIPPTYTAGTLINRSTTADDIITPRREIQNDYAFNFETGPVSHKLLLGLDLVDFPQESYSWSSGGSSRASSSPVDPFALVHPGTVTVDYSRPVSYQAMTQNYQKGYLLETAGLFDDRVLLTWGVSRHRFALSSATYPYNQNTGVAGTPSIVPSTALFKNLVQYGVVVKPTENISVFYGRNANFAANPIQNGAFLPPQQGLQREAGIKADFIPGRLTLNTSYFEIFQVNNSLPANPQTSPPTQVLIPGQTSRGFDGDFTYSPTRNLDLIASFAIFDTSIQAGPGYRSVPQPYDGRIRTTLPVNNVSDRTFSAMVRYRFLEGPLNGFSFAIANTNLSRRAVTDSSNQILYTYLPGYSLFNVMASYTRDNFTVQLNVDNVFNENYWFSSRSNLLLFPGTPTNPRVTFTYRF